MTEEKNIFSARTKKENKIAKQRQEEGDSIFEAFSENVF